MTGRDKDTQAQVSNKGKVLIQCLDRSGSMKGGPMDALKEGAMLSGDAVFGKSIEENSFERVITIPYDN